MNENTEKKGILGIAATAMGASSAAFANGEFVVGGALGVLSVGTFIGYDIVDDRVKGRPEDHLPLLDSQYDEVGDEVIDAVEEEAAQYSRDDPHGEGLTAKE